MVTAADGAESFYTSQNNKARYESVSEAVGLDKRLINAWVGHPHFSIIHNRSTFSEKMDQCLGTVLHFIGLPSPTSSSVNKYLLIADQTTNNIEVP